MEPTHFKKQGHGGGMTKGLQLQQRCAEGQLGPSWSNEVVQRAPGPAVAERMRQERKGGGRKERRRQAVGDRPHYIVVSQLPD